MPGEYGPTGAGRLAAVTGLSGELDIRFGYCFFLIPSSPSFRATSSPAVQADEGADASAAQPRTKAARRAKAPAPDAEDDGGDDAEDPQEVATRLLERALRIGHEKDDAEWLHSSAVKGQMKRMDPSFSEKAIGYRSFSDFVKSRHAIAELDESGTARLVRLTPAGAK